MPNRRDFLRSTISLAGAAALGQSPAKYTRYNVASPGGKKALASYAKGVAAMLRLPANHPQNWFHNAFVHLMDCPHGNWWFYVWHRGYIGYLEQTIRNLSGDPTFALPYWDWTTLPQIPDGMFDAVLTPRDAAFERYTGNLAVFTSFTRPALTSYWNSLNAQQRAQLNTRGYTDIDKVWNDVTGYDTTQQAGISGNMAYANTCNARYLTRDNPKLDKKTAYDVSPFIVYSGLWPTEFLNPNGNLSFNSSKTPSHNTAPSDATVFSVLEGFPHNKVHNYIGGVGPLDPGPYGNMTNFLSPVDPIFFLHHANMDRLWDVWTRKQKSIGKPWLPAGADLKTWSDEPFLFYVNGNGQYVGASTAGEYIDTAKFGYRYEPGFGEDTVQTPNPKLVTTLAPPLKGALKGNTASVSVPTSAIRNHLASSRGASLVALVTLPRPSAVSAAREFDVMVGAPASVTHVDADSPYYAGTLAFFGKMSAMKGMSADATFAVPLPKAPAAFRALTAAANQMVDIRIASTQSTGESAPAIKAVSVQML